MDNTCKKCRREGVKLFLKGAKCDSPKCPLTRRNYPPGDAGARRRQTKTSDFALQLREKQKAKKIYHISEKQFRKYFLNAAKKEGSTSLNLLQILEARLDNAIFRAGLTVSRAAARQIANHGKAKLNNKKVNIPSILVKKGDKIQVDLPKNIAIPNAKPANWIKLDKKNNTFEIINQPQTLSEELGLNTQLIIEYYSR
ncbi:MAG: small subunit ribosomal protein S4 [Candidatus Berkelbacteria bacterium Licking1014_7]|uniref:Small ribosomal subunit protein uS4 n=1 Tax=Candidatus Berkelbacteria bacterium Licking1014_7 TaxID=2017147 RepID=A0A554LIS3_9BACT|nr:MAG: small subunit ribosomal protein S4 [Candidatus Berkelbacteria bacterium Licking1014_7]